MSRKLLATVLGVCVGTFGLLQLPGGPPRATSAPERLARSPSASSPSAPAVRDELLVRFARSADASDRARLREAADTDLERTLPVPGLQLLDVEGGQSVRQAVSELERASEVVYAEPNFRRSATVIPDDRHFAYEWGLHNSGQSLEGNAGTPDADIDAPETWDTTTGSAEVTVAVVDSGVDVDHPDLRGNVWSNPGERGDGRETNGVDDDGNGLRDDWRGWDWIDSDNLPSDANGHGTHVTGTIAARGGDGFGVAGVSWTTRVMPLRVLDADGSGTVADVVSAYRYAAASGAQVVNASLGGGSYSRAEADAIASAPGVLFVVAAGNGGADGIGDDNDLSPEYPCGYPARNVLCVAASDRRDALASFSNYGATSVELAAPGVDILSTRPGSGFAFLDGTSMATPHVAGAAALLFAMAERSPTVATVQSALLGGVDGKAAFGDRTVTGGRLNVERSLRILDPDAPAETQPAPGAGPRLSPPARTPVVAADNAPPTVSLTVRRQRLHSVLLRGLRARAACSEACSLTARLLVPPRTARRLLVSRARRAVAVGRASKSLSAGGASLRIKLSEKSRRKLKRAKGLHATVRVLARDAAGNMRRLDRRVKLVR